MKISIKPIAALFLAVGLTLQSCEAVQNANNEQKGTAAGAAAGAVIGGILGNNIGKGRNAPAGAVLGGIIGGIVGNRIGNKMDKQAKEISETLPGAKVERINEGIKVTMDESIVNFAFDKSDLSATAMANLDKLAAVLEKNPDTNINVYGYTDSKGSDAYNQALSERRAESVKNYLIQHGVLASRIVAMGMGESSPVASNDTEAGRAMNRRVEFAITASEKMIREASQN